MAGAHAALIDGRLDGAPLFRRGVVLEEDRELCGRCHPRQRALDVPRHQQQRAEDDERERDGDYREQRRGAGPHTGFSTPDGMRSRALSRHLRDPALLERDGAAADQPDQLAIVRRHQHRGPAGVHLAQEVHDLQRQVGIEVTGGLVGEEERRVVDQRPGDGNALLFPTGQIDAGKAFIRCWRPTHFST